MGRTHGGSGEWGLSRGLERWVIIARGVYVSRRSPLVGQTETGIWQDLVGKVKTRVGQSEKVGEGGRAGELGIDCGELSV